MTIHDTIGSPEENKKDKIDAYFALMVEQNSLDTIRDTLKINKKTAFDWRHTILSSLSDPDRTDFSGITESDETVDMSVATMGRIKASDIERAIGGRMKPGTAILCSDAHRSYQKFAREHQLEHRVLNGTIKQNRDMLKAFVSKTVESVTAYQNSGAIEDRYHRLVSTQT